MLIQSSSSPRSPYLLLFLAKVAPVRCVYTVLRFRTACIALNFPLSALPAPLIRSRPQTQTSHYPLFLNQAIINNGGLFATRTYTFTGASAIYTSGTSESTGKTKLHVAYWLSTGCLPQYVFNNAEASLNVNFLLLSLLRTIVFILQLQQTISRLTDECWDKCISSPGITIFFKLVSCM